MLIVNKEFQMNKNQRRQKAINRLGFKHSHCHRSQSSRTNRGESEQQENWLQLRNRRREQYRQLLRKNQLVTGENDG